MSDVRAYYDQDKEEERLLVGTGPLELARTQELLARFLRPGSRIADVGGGTGRYAEWLVEQGHEVELVDPMELHVDRARLRAAGRFAVHRADGRSLPFEAATFDAVLLLGPVYHLERRAERIAVAAEAVRVCKAGGIVVAAAISRLAPLLGVVASGRVLEPEVLANVRDEVRAGTRVPPERRTGLFPDAYFHLPHELRDELTEAGLDVQGVYGVEGPAWLIRDFEQAWGDGGMRERILAAARELEAHEHAMGISPHLLAVAFRP